jgi:hypothetical protein
MYSSPTSNLDFHSLLLNISLGSILLVFGCGDPVKEVSIPPHPDTTPAIKGKNDGQGAQGTKLNQSPPQEPEVKIPVIPPHQRILVVENGEERYISEEDARSKGYDIIDLRDQWTPYIFKTHKNPEGEQLEHAYREIFVNLANDKGNNQGQPIGDDEYNFLEVFGIPPSFNVLWHRVNREINDACYREVDYEKIQASKSIRFGSKSSQRRYRKRVKRAESVVERAMNKYVVDSYEDLLKVAPKYKSEVKELRKYQTQIEAIRNIEKRLTCDLHNHPRYHHKEERLDQGLRLAIRRFQRKHKLYEYANLKSDSIDALATPAHVSNFNSFRRAVTERIIEVAGILEDGTVNRKGTLKTYLGKDGQRHEVRNLIKEFTDASLTQLNLDDPYKVREFFKRHEKEDFKWMRVGVHFPDKPEYYSKHMDFSIVVDRGDIWYDPPFNAKGKKIKQRRRRLPKFKLYTTYNDERVQLIHWPTTIGGWRTEIAKNGHVYYKYKNSDVGSRVIRNIISGPVWVPPKSTPLKSLAKRRYINGRAQNVVNYEEMGPGYLSAYGLVAGYFVIPGRNGRADYDKGIRAHGSSDFMSILSPERFSHGCHRLKNDHAVRLYSFILQHRNRIVHGDQKIRHEREFLHREEVFQVRVLTRGYKYELQPPIPVEVLEGRVRGKLKKPIEDYVEDPSHDYPDGNPDDSPVPEELQEKPELEGEAAQEEAGTKVDPSLKTDQKPANTKEAPDKTAKQPSTKNPTE